MKLRVIVLIALIIISSCKSAIPKSDDATVKVNYEQMVGNYLGTKAIRPTLVYNNDKLNEFSLLNHHIVWKELDSGIKIMIDGHSISTTDKLTLNEVEKSGKVSVDFANYLQQVKIYENESLIGFVLTFYPCTGTGCSISYHIIYDLRTRKQSYFGRFRTGSEFELYDFNSDGRPDYLGTETEGPSADGVMSKEFVLYSQAKSGEFEELSTKEQERFWFRHTLNESQQNIQDERFEENWIEKINKKVR